MNDRAQFAPSLEQIARVLAAFREGEIEDAQKRKDEERKFERIVREYILNECQQYAHGGVVNALSTIARVCEELDNGREGRYAEVSRLIDGFSDQCDLDYPGEGDD